VRDGSGAAESVWAVALRAKTSSASDRVPGVKPEGVATPKWPSEGGKRLDWSVILTVSSVSCTLLSLSLHVEHTRLFQVLVI
jgi:hypothetical protein